MSRASKKRKLVAEINVVPYIDVMLVLLVIFMVTAPLLTQGVQVDLPKASAVPVKTEDEKPLIVSVKEDGSYYLNVGGDEKVAQELELIEDKVAKILRQKPATQVLIWGDAQVDYGVVVKLMARLQSAGAATVGLVTENP